MFTFCSQGNFHVHVYIAAKAIFTVQLSVGSSFWKRRYRSFRIPNWYIPPSESFYLHLKKKKRILLSAQTLSSALGSWDSCEMPSSPSLWYYTKITIFFQYCYDTISYKHSTPSDPWSLVSVVVLVQTETKKRQLLWIGGSNVNPYSHQYINYMHKRMRK
jgi:hypothetical protein